MWMEAILFGLAAGILVGLIGIGGGVVIVPATLCLSSIQPVTDSGCHASVGIPFAIPIRSCDAL